MLIHSTCVEAVIRPCHFMKKIINGHFYQCCDVFPASNLHFTCVSHAHLLGGPCELSAAGDLWHWKPEQSGDKGKSCHYARKFRANEMMCLMVSGNTISILPFLSLISCTILQCFLLSPLFSPQRTRTVTTAASVWFVYQTCVTHWFSLAGTCVCAMPVLTHCVTRPTTALSADCVSAH